MKKILVIMISAMLMSLSSETLFEVKDASDNKVFDISNDGMRVFSLGDTLMIISATEIRANLGDGKEKGLSRSFSVATTSSVKGSGDVFKVSSAAAPDLVDKNTMLWYPQKNAFRVGKVLIQHPDSVGTNSFASGYNSQAMGNNSFAMGYYSRAIQSNSMAFGQNARALGYECIALGVNAKATGDNSFAVQSSTASGNMASVAFGYQTTASGNASTSMGSATKAIGAKSTAMGANTEAIGTSSLATGESSIAKGSNSFSSGSNTKAYGSESATFGYQTTSLGSFSISSGLRTIAQSYGSFVIGQNNIATGDSSSWISTDPLFVIGNGSSTSSRANAVTVLKNGNTTINGSLTLASGGAVTRFSTDGTMAGNSDSYVPTEKAVRTYVTASKDDLGDHTATQNIRLNGYYLSNDGGNEGIYVDADGDVGIGTNSPGSNRLKVISSTAVSNVSGATGYFENSYSAGMGLAALATSTDVALYAEQKNTSSTTANIVKFASMYGGSWSEKFSIRSTGRIYASSLSTGTGTELYLTSGNEIVKLSSSKKYKKDIEPLAVNHEKFMKLQPVSFKWNEKTASENVSDCGLIAEDVQKIDPELAIYNSEGSIEGVNYQKLNIMILKVVQEQQNEIEELKKQISELKDMIK